MALLEDETTIDQPSIDYEALGLEPVVEEDLFNEDAGTQVAGAVTTETPKPVSSEIDYEGLGLEPVEEDDVFAAPIEPIPVTGEEGFLRQAADVPLKIGESINNSLKGLTDLFGADNAISQNLTQNANWYRSLLSAQALEDEQEVGRILQEAENEGLLGQLGAGLEAFSVAPVDFVASGIGSLAVFAAGGLAGRAAGLGAKGIQAVQAGLSAGMGAGIAKGEIYQSVKDEMLAQGKTEEEAKRVAMEAQSFGGKNLDQILIAAGLGTIDAYTGAEKIIGKVLAKGGLKPDVSRVASVIKNGITEGAPEFIQAAQEKFASNVALQREGVDVPLTQGVFSQGALEGLVGVGMGAGVAAIEPRIQTPPTKEEISAAAAETQDVARRSTDVAPATAAIVENQANEIMVAATVGPLARREGETDAEYRARIEASIESPEQRVARLQREAQEAAGEIELEEEPPVSGLPPVEPTPTVTPTPEAAVAPVEPVVPEEGAVEPAVTEVAPEATISEETYNNLAVQITESSSPSDWKTQAIESLVEDGSTQEDASAQVEGWSNDTTLNFLTDRWKTYWKENPDEFASEYENYFGTQPPVQPTPEAVPVTPTPTEPAATALPENWQSLKIQDKASWLSGQVAGTVVGSAAREGQANDIDIRVEETQAPDAVAKLQQLGYETAGESLVSPEEAQQAGKDFGGQWARSRRMLRYENGRLVDQVDIWSPDTTPEITPQLEPLRRVARAEQTEEDVAGLVDGGLVELYKGQPVITQAGIDALPEAERPRLTPEARKIQIDTRTSEAAAEAISKNLRIGVDQVPFDVKMPTGWTLEGDVYVPPQPQAVTKPEAPITPEAVEPSREQIRGLLRELNSVERAAISGRMVEEGIISKEDADRYIFEAIQFGADPRKISDAEEAANEKWDSQKEAYIASGRVAGEVEIPPVDHTAEESERAKQLKVNPRTALDPVEFNGLTAREALLKLASMNFGASEYEATGRELSMDMTLQRVASALSKLPLRGLDAELILFSKKRTGDFLAYRAHAGNIYIPQTSGGKKAYISPQTLVHEIGHTLTLDAFNKYIKASGVKAGEPYYKNLERALKAKNTPRPVKKIIALYIETIDQLGLRDMYFGKKGLANDDAPESRKRARERKDRPINPITGEPFTFSQLYGLANIDEFVSETFSNPAFQDFVKTISVDGGQRSAWRKFVEAIRELFGFPSKSIAEQVVNASIQAAGLEAETMYGRTVAQRLQDIADAKKKKIQQGIVDQEKAKIKLSWKKSTSDWGAQLHNATYKFPKKNPIADTILIEIEKDATGYGGYMISVEGKKDGSFVDLSKYLKGVYGITSLKNAKDAVLTAIYDISLTTGRPAPEVMPMAPRTNEEQIAFEKASSNRVLARSPELAVAAVRLKNGEITSGEYADLVDAIDPFIAKGADPIPTQEKIKQYIAADKAPMVGVEIENGKEVEFRIDIPTYNRSTANGDPVYAITAHEPVAEDAKRVGAPISYMGVAKVINPTFMTRAISGKGAAIEIAMGAGKFPLATVKGNYEAITDLPEDINNPEVWTEVGYNPIRSSFFVDTRSGDAVISGSEAIMVGSRVFVKNAEMEPRPRDITMGGRYAPEPEGGFPTFTEGTPEAATLKAMEASMVKVDAASEAKGGKPETQKISDIAANWMDQGGDERALQDAIVENTNLTPANAARVAKAIARQYGIQQGLAEARAQTAEGVSVEAIPEGATIPEETNPKRPKTTLQRVIDAITGVRVPPVKITANEKTLLKEQIKLKAAATREAKKAQQEMAADVVDAIKAMDIRGGLRPKQVSALMKRAALINFASEKSVDRFTNYAEKVIANANYDRDLSEAKLAQKRARELAKSKRVPSNQQDALNGIADIEVGFLDDPREFAEAANHYMRGFKSVVSEDYVVVPDDEMTSYLSVKEDEAGAARSDFDLESITALAEKYGVSVSDVNNIINAQDTEASLAQYANREVFEGLLSEKAKQSLSALKKYDASGMTQSQQSMVAKAIDLDVEALEQQDKVDLVRRIDNILVNGRTNGFQKYVDIAEAQSNARKAARDGTFTDQMAAWINILTGKAIGSDITLVGKKQQKELALTMQSVADTFRNIFGKKQLGKAQRIIGHFDLIKATTAANNDVDSAGEQMEKFYSEQYKKYGRALSAPETIMAEGIAGYLIQSVPFKSEGDSIAQRRRLIQEDIRVRREDGDQEMIEAADMIEEQLAKVDGDSVQEILNNLKSSHPAAYESLIWMKDTLLPQYKEFLKAHDENYNDQTNNYENPNYLPIKYKFVGAIDLMEDSGKYARLDSLTPKQAANTIKRVDYTVLPRRKGSTAQIDYSIRKNTFNSLAEQLRKAHTSSAWTKIDAFLKSKDAPAVFGGKVNVNFMADRLKLLKDSQERRSYEWRGDAKFFDALATISRKFGIGYALGGIYQPFKQVPDQLMTTVANTGRTDLLSSNFGTILFQPKTSGAMNMLSKFSIGRRGDAAMGGTKFVNEVESNYTNLERYFNGGNWAAFKERAQKLNDIWLYALKKSDYTAAAASWMTYYQAKLAQDGIKFTDWNQEAQLVEADAARQEAAAYAESMTDIYQGSSDPTNMATFAQRGKSGYENIFKAIFMPLNSFALQQRSRIMSDGRDAMTKSTDPERRSLGGYGLAATLGGMFLFHATRRFFLPVVSGLGAASIYALLGIDPEEPDEEKKAEMAKFRWRQFTSEFAANIFVGGFGSLPEAPFIDALNRAAYFGAEQVDSETLYNDKGEKMSYSAWTRNNSPFWRYKEYGSGMNLGMLDITSGQIGEVADVTRKLMDPERYDILTEDEKRLIYFAALSEWLYTLRLNDTDMNRMIRNMAKETEMMAKEREAELKRIQSER